MGVQKTWAILVGIVLLIVGVTGFFATDSLLGFGINAPHNVVHLVTGLIFLWAGLKGKEAGANKGLGLIYIIVGIVGFFEVLTFLNINTADNWLHIVIGVISTLVGFTAD